MSVGLVICSVCKREVHQDGPENVSRGWQHCEGKSRMCLDASAIYPTSYADIVGKWCGRDDPNTPPDLVFDGAPGQWVSPKEFERLVSDVIASEKKRTIWDF